MLRILVTLLCLYFSCTIIDKTDRDKKSIIELERTACFGNCPIYKIEIFSNGNVIYKGEKFVDNIGIFKFKINISSIKEILEYAEEIKFSSMKDEYTGPVSDLPTTFVRIRTKSVKNHIGGPNSLRELEKMIDKVSQQITQQSSREKDP